ncbi:uncharacterized protein TRAVEDRAFT_23109 [Trametes versicolor FP-101664 SS1]|uniref:uncharacterized protein n=1 Tax=Trametes versicolor (strain FP-101664) TaxID=717944 RepID=UPI0004622308|nr:uncharacterized protein TRAVEDRAFT_23109 [Trametes versicolor FP-101664 SS1]EIW53814.1 hypothetical protein TRAVEDRAFT_23109 [Trametes versicolor FP-101664 SS1]
MAPISTFESTITDGESFTTLFVCEDFCRSIIVPISTGAGSQAPPERTTGVANPLSSPSSALFVSSATGSTPHIRLSASATPSPSDRPKTTFTIPAAPASAQSPSDRPLTTFTLSAFTSNSASASPSASIWRTATSEREVPSSPSTTSHASTNSPATSSRAPLKTSSSGSSSASPPASAEPAHRVVRTPTLVLAGAVVASAVLAAAAAAFLLRLWIRRRRTHTLLSTQSRISDMSACSDLSHSMAAVPAGRPCSRVLSKSQAEGGVMRVRPRTRSSLSESGSSRGALYGSATSFGPPSTPRSLAAAHADRKNDQQHGQELPIPPLPAPAPPSTESLPEPQGNTSDVERETVEVHSEAHHAGERLLHLALPWALGQRMLAMMAGEDRVGGEGEETLPAYEPRV